MIISSDAEKSFDKIQCPFIIKTPNKLIIEENYLNLKSTHEKPTANICSAVKDRKLFLLRV